MKANMTYTFHHLTPYTVSLDSIKLDAKSLRFEDHFALAIGGRRLLLATFLLDSGMRQALTSSLGGFLAAGFAGFAFEAGFDFFAAWP